MEAEQLPGEWKWVRICEIADTTSGGTPSRSHSEYYGGNIPWVKSGELKDNIICSSEESITDLGLRNSNAKLFPKNTVVVALYGATVGRTGILNFDAATNQAVCAVYPRENGFTAKYMFYWLQSIRQYLINMSVGAAQPNISQAIIRTLDFPLAPLAEQERIVAKIEALFSQLEAGVAALRRAQAGLKRYKASLLKAAYEGRLVPQDPSDEPAEVVLRRLGKSPLQDASLPSLPRGWCWVTMSEVADINLREPFIRNLPDDLLVTFVPMAAVNAEMGIIVKPEQRPLKEVRKGFTSFLEGDVIFAKITPCMENGKAAIVPKLHNGVGFGSTEFHVLRPRENVISQWLFYFVRRESFRVDAKASFTGTAGQLRVPAKFLASYPFPLPPLAEQERIVAELEQRLTVVAQVEAAIQAALTRSARLRQAILKRAFRGEL